MNVALHYQYCQMAAQARRINAIITQFIASQAESNPLFAETLKISNDTSALLNSLGKGYLAPDTSEVVYIYGILEEIKTIFFAELIEKKIVFKVHGNIDIIPYVDPIILKACLFNIFQIILNRARLNNTLDVYLFDESPLKIKFVDDGYNIELKPSKFKDPAYSKNLLYMEREKLIDFIHGLGWKIIFSTENKTKNSIEISIPLDIKNRKLPENVVYLFKS